jgi:hypothetical protein
MKVSDTPNVLYTTHLLMTSMSPDTIFHITLQNLQKNYLKSRCEADYIHTYTTHFDTEADS